MSNVSQLLPNWSEDDFYDEVPYKWLYAQREDKFLFQQLLAKVQVKAKQLGIVGFTKMWNAYVSAMAPKTSVLGVNVTEFPDQPVQLQCGKYICDEYGIHYTGRMGEDITVCSHPIMPIKRILNVDTNDEKLEVAYRRGIEKWRTLVAGCETLASAQKVIGLAKNGIAVNSENAKEIVKYITDIVSANIDELPTQHSTGHLGWLPDGQFAPYAEGIDYDGESPENARIYNAFKPHGNYDSWLDIAKSARAGQSIPARIALAGAFAAPLIPLMRALPFIIHFYGTSGMGKSVGLMLSASVWAEPTVGGTYIKTFGGTKVSQEVTASFLCNVPMYLDELQIISDRKTFDDMIYMLCEGSSKPRGTKDGGLQLQKSWANVILTTGEMPIVQSNSGGGAAARTIEVDYGGVPFFEDSRSVANALKANYGFAGRKFIEALQQEGTLDRVKAIQNEFYGLLSGDIHGKQVLSASILLAADALADSVIFHDGKSLTVDEIKPYLITNQQVDANFRCYQWLQGVIASNPKRFDASDDNNGEVWGVRDDGNIYIIRTIFDRLLTDGGFSPTTFLKWASRNGRIAVENYGYGNQNNRLTKRKNIQGHPVTCVALVPEEADGFVEVDSEQLPF